MGSDWISPLKFTDSRLVQCPQRTVTMFSMLLLGTLTARIVLQKLQCT
uniref:Uncharacterized protein n=1 Tax=Arundo donax TaxID=35708 RepID=A0A0A9DA76_ARUDO